jgi:hypothetical protein
MIAGAVILIVIIYLLTSRFTYGIGFPLDDSWIHQTYARNLPSGGGHSAQAFLRWLHFTALVSVARLGFTSPLAHI